MPEHSTSSPIAAPPKTDPSDIRIPDIFPTIAPEQDFWQLFGCAHVADSTYLLAPGAIALRAIHERHHSSLIELTKTLAVPSHIAMVHGQHRQALYRMGEPALDQLLSKGLPPGVEIVRSGDPIDLPDDWCSETGRARSVDELTEITVADVARIGKPQVDAVVTSNPLLPFSLRGQSEQFKRLAIEARPLLGEVCLRGQVTIWYAAPGTGKTLVALSLLLDAIREERIAAGNVFYVNADDNGQGFATKLQIMDDVGANTLAPGFKGFRAPELIALLHKMADQNEARGVLVIIDTIKKFASLMEKRESSDFAQACRRVAMMGGSVLGLAHTTKNPNSDGTPRYAGTSDLVDDADAAYTLRLTDAGGNVAEKVVEFRCFKSRGDCAETAAYAFASERGVTYEEKLTSVHPVDPMHVDEFKRVEEQRSDADVIEAACACIAEGFNTKMVLAKETAARINISARAAGRLIERYTGENPQMHRWRFRRASRGAQVYEVLSPAPT